MTSIAVDIYKRQAQLRLAALEYLAKHHEDAVPAGTPPLLERCIAHLIESHEVSRATAENAALLALGEQQARDSSLYIDCSQTTSYVLHLVDAKTNKRWKIPVSALLHDLSGFP